MLNSMLIHIFIIIILYCLFFSLYLYLLAFLSLSPTFLHIFSCLSSSVAAESETNKMTLNNLATLFGPNLLRPGSQSAAAAFDVMSPVNVLMFFLVCPIEVYDDPNSSNSAPSSASKKSKKRQELLPLEGEDTSSITSSQSTGFVSTALPPPASSPSHTVHASSSTPSLPLSSVASPVSPTSVASSPTVVSTTTSASSGGGVVSTASVSVSSASTPLRYKQSAI